MKAEDLFWELAAELQAEDPRVVEGTSKGQAKGPPNPRETPFGSAGAIEEWSRRRSAGWPRAASLRESRRRGRSAQLRYSSPSA